MSLHHELKGIDDKLRGLMNRRDRISKALSKAKSKIRWCIRKIERADVALEALKNRTAENNAACTELIETNELNVTRHTALLKEAEHDVDKRLEEIGAL